MGDIIFTRDYFELHSMNDFKIFVNDKEAATISNGARKVLKLEPGTYRIYVKVNATRSPEKQVEVKEKGTVRLSCGSTLTGIKLVFSWFFAFSKKGLYLKETV